jgi:hypothetical protein
VAGRVRGDALAGRDTAGDGAPLCVPGPAPPADTEGVLPLADEDMRLARRVANASSDSPAGMQARACMCVTMTMDKQVHERS